MNCPNDAANRGGRFRAEGRRAPSRPAATSMKIAVASSSAHRDNIETRAGPAVPSFRPRNQLMMSVNSNAASFEPVRLTIAVVDEQDCVRMGWEVR